MGDVDLLHRLETDEQRALWGLRAASRALNRDSVTAAEIADVLATEGRLSMSRQKITAVLEAAGPAVRRTKSCGRRQFQLMKAGEESIGDGGPGAVIVDPARGLDAIRRLEEIFAGLTGTVRVCDPYVDTKTVDYLSAMGSAAHIKLLTHNVLGERTFRRDLIALGRQMGIPVEVRVTTASENHDRYVLAENAGFLIGSSLNGFAKKRSFVTPITGLRAAVLKAFEQDWNRASKF